MTYRTLISFVIVAVGVLLPGSGHAAQVVFQISPGAATLCTPLVTDVLFRPDGESLNAVEGEVHFSDDRLAVLDIRDADSAIPFWIDRPVLASPGRIVFSGIVPGGFVRNQERLFSVIFQAKKSGRAEIRGEAMRALKNDGAGTNAVVTVPAGVVTVAGPDVPCDTLPVVEASASSTAFVADREPPEAFTPTVSRTPDLFDGAWFLVFSTQDKGSGMDRYEIREGKKADFIVAQSPHLLSDQSLRSDIAIKAIDRAGNVRESFIRRPTSPLWVYATIVLCSIMSVRIILFLKKKKWQRAVH